MTLFSNRSKSGFKTAAQNGRNRTLAWTSTAPQYLHHPRLSLEVRLSEARYSTPRTLRTMASEGRGLPMGPLTSTTLLDITTTRWDTRIVRDQRSMPRGWTGGSEVAKTEVNSSYDERQGFRSQFLREITIQPTTGYRRIVKLIRWKTRFSISLKAFKRQTKHLF